MGSLSHDERVRIKVQLGYPGYGSVASASGGLPVLRSPDFMIDLRLDRLNDDATIALIRRYLELAEQAECQISKAAKQLSVASVGNINLRGTARGERVTDLLEQENVRWCYRIADILCVSVYPFAEKFRHRGPGSCVPVRS